MITVSLTDGWKLLDRYDAARNAVEGLEKRHTGLAVQLQTNPPRDAATLLQDQVKLQREIALAKRDLDEAYRAVVQWVESRDRFGVPFMALRALLGSR